MTKNIIELNTIVDKEREEYLRLLDRHEKILISYGKEITKARINAMNGQRMINYIKYAIKQTNEKVLTIDQRARLQLDEQAIINEALKEMTQQNFQKTEDIINFIWNIMNRMTKTKYKTKEKDDMRKIEAMIKKMIGDQITSDFCLPPIEPLPVKPQTSSRD